MYPCLISRVWSICEEKEQAEQLGREDFREEEPGFRRVPRRGRVRRFGPKA